MRAPLVVNTRDGVCWTRRAVTSGGIALYAPEAVRTCPEFVMATIDELAEQGIVGSAFSLPMPVAPEPEAGERTKVAELIGDAAPATDGLLEQLAGSVRDVREHEHPTWEDLYCLNLVSWMGERMGPVLRRLLDAEARAERYRIAWGMARARALSTGGAADRYAARARDAQEALQHMLFTVIAGQMALKAATDRVAELETDLAAKGQDHAAAVAGWGRARDRVAELEARLAEHDRPADEDPIASALTEQADDVTPQVAKLRALLAGQATDGSEFFQPGHAYTHRPGADTIGGPRLRFYCETVTTDPATGQPVARGWGGRRYGDRWTSVQQARGLGDWQSGAWVDTTTGGDV